MTASLVSSAHRLGPAFDLLAAYQDGGSFFERSAFNDMTHE